VPPPNAAIIAGPAGASKTAPAGRRRIASIRDLCEHVFVSIKGRPYTWFKAALARGDLAGVRAAAAELPEVNLADALAICVLMGLRDDVSYERAATKWLARLALERPAVGLDELGRALLAMEALPDNPAAAKSVLAGICRDHGLPDAVRLLTGRK
jgi:hypothetical protein